MGQETMRMRRPDEATILFLTLFATAPVAAQLPPRPEGPGGTPVRLPRILVEQRMKDLGQVYAGDRVQADWVIRNAGAADLVIERTQVSCGCTILRLTDADKVIPPNGSLTLAAEFDSTSRKGEQVKSVTLFVNDPLEPQVELSFRANVVNLYYMMPAGRLNLRSIRPGQSAPDTLDVTPGEDGTPVTIESLTFKNPDVFSYTVESLELTNGKGHRFRFTLTDSAAVGPIMAMGTLTLKVGDVRREIEIQVFAEVVADLTSQPKMIVPTGQTLYPGRRLAPVIIRSTEERPFEILEVSVPSWLKATVERPEEGVPASSYTVSIVIGDEAPVGPFGVPMVVRTDHLTQPLLEVPLFGIIASPVVVDPPMIVLRDNGTTAGTSRRVRLQASPRSSLDVSSAQCAEPAVAVAVDPGPDDKTPFIKFLDVNLSGKLPAGTHQTSIRLTTNVPGASLLTIPVSIEVQK